MTRASALYPRVAAVREAFADPAVRAEFERWRAERAAAGKQLRAPSEHVARGCAAMTKDTPAAGPRSS